MKKRIVLLTAVVHAVAANSARAQSLIAVSNELGHTVTLIDAATLKVVRTIGLPQRPRGIAFTPNGKQIFVALSDPDIRRRGGGDAIAAIDVQRNTITALFPAGSDPERFAITPDGKRMYSANEDGNSATATDIASRKEIASLIVGIEPEGVGITPDGRWCYVTAETSNSVSVIDIRSNKVVAPM